MFRLDAARSGRGFPKTLRIAAFLLTAERLDNRRESAWPADRMTVPLVETMELSAEVSQEIHVIERLAAVKFLISHVLQKPPPVKRYLGD